ncbi:MAG: leucine--tRNA ligase [Chitinophagaceae bacterium]|nr:leucine--tRNA ligase [Bacteroidota bacterium]MCC6258433.1 leucine--tRNA ligase [Chitinophagaceae bacterium]MCW5916554.1 leucine--tRNA ligase [Ferruginibacter sp.]
MEYSFGRIEEHWKEKWKKENIYRINNNSDKPKYYVLDMFPYPSGAGLHVGHPLGYIASDIFSRYKRLKGFNVLHPMGFDSFGLPAEQYALETGQHPAETTRKNIATFKSQLDKIGFCYDWEREVQTSSPGYYKWTQWIFLQLFNSYYCSIEQKAKPIRFLVEKFEKDGSDDFSATDWKSFSARQQADILMQFRLVYSAFGVVNWCPALGTVLANDEVVNGVSARGGHPVIKKKMRQWFLRITAFAERLLQGLDHVDFSDSMKEMQRNWIGRSEGAEMEFEVEGISKKILVYTTRPDTIFGVDFLVLAPEHELVAEITPVAQRQSINEYLTYVKSRSDRDRMADVKQITGCFTGSYAINPLNGRKIPVWIAEYVLAGYGTGAIMAVPCGDQRDFNFAQHFNIPITNIIGSYFNGREANPTKDAVLENSGFLNGLLMKDAMEVAIGKIESSGIGKRKVNYRMRDAGFSRQRYWGEPFPIIWKDGIAVPLEETSLPLELPHVGQYSPGPEGEGPLANLTEWINTANGSRESSTMPGYAGSSWYFLRFMDPHNPGEFCSRSASDYWNQVDVYIGGTEHAVGHLLYSRMWTKFLFDQGLIGFDEPFKRLINQGMIQGSSRFVYRVDGTNQFVSYGLKENYTVDKLHVDVNMVDGFILETEAFKKWRPDFANAEFILEDGKYICGSETEKMSKSKFNTVNPDILVEKYGADTFRMYEMFLGPIEQSKPWDAKGIDGVHRFLRKLWRLFFDEQKNMKLWTEEQPNEAELKCLHRGIKKIEDDTERFSFNTAVSAFMILVNELSDLKCHKKSILEKVLVMLAPYAPFISEELWHQMGNETSILNASYPETDKKYLVDATKEYPVSINGKLRTNMLLPLDADPAMLEKEVLANEVVQKWLEGKTMKKFIYVKGKMINVVI